MSSNKTHLNERTIGRVYMQLNRRIYKLVTMRAGADGSLYIGMPLGRKYSKQGLSAPKITYHPDGNMWVTSEIQPKYLSERDAESIPQGDWQGRGLSVKNKKIYVRGLNHTATTPLDSIQELLPLNKGIQYFNLQNINADEVFVEASEQKTQKARIVTVDGYSNVQVQFYLVHHNFLKDAMQSLSGDRLNFRHPLMPIHFIVRITDEKPQTKTI